MKSIRVPVSVLGTLVGIFFMTAGTAHATPITVGSITSSGGGNGASIVSGSDPIFDFSFTGGGYTANGEVNTDLLTDNTYVATSGYITIAGPTNAGTYTLPNNCDSGGVDTCTPFKNSTGNAGWIFQYDDKVLGDPALLDVWGLFFTNGTGMEINLWNNGGNFTLAGIQEGSGTNIAFSANGDLAPVPEPASLLLLGTGLFAGATRLRRRFRI